MTNTTEQNQTATSSFTEVSTVLADTKIAYGGTQPGATDWKKLDKDAGIFVNVDTSAAQFTKTPIYITSLVGGSDSQPWGMTGASSIYKPTATGFSIYIKWDNGLNDSTPLTPEFANTNQWHINWIGIEPFVKRSLGSKSTL